MKTPIDPIEQPKEIKKILRAKLNLAKRQAGKNRAAQLQNGANTFVRKSKDTKSKIRHKAAFLARKKASAIDAVNNASTTTKKVTTRVESGVIIARQGFNKVTKAANSAVRQTAKVGGGVAATSKGISKINIAISKKKLKNAQKRGKKPSL